MLMTFKHSEYGNITHKQQPVLCQDTYYLPRIHHNICTLSYTLFLHAQTTDMQVARACRCLQRLIIHAYGWLTHNHAHAQDKWYWQITAGASSMHTHVMHTILRTHKTNCSLLVLARALPIHAHITATYQHKHKNQIHVGSLQMLAGGHSCIWFDVHIV